MKRENLDNLKLELNNLPSLHVDPINWPEEFTKDQRKAIDIAVKNGLEYEVCKAMFNQGMSPEEALREWDLL